MAYTDKNAAYDLSLFEPATASAKKQEQEKVKKNNVISIDKAVKAEPAKKVSLSLVLSVALTVAIVVGGVIAVLCGYARLTELNQEVVDANARLAEKESIYVQNEMKVEAELSPEIVEEYAVNVLGMTKTDASKKEFIKLSDGDKAVIADGSDRRFGDYLLETIATLW